MARPRIDPVERLLLEWAELTTDQQQAFISGLTLARKIMERYMPAALPVLTQQVSTPAPKRGRSRKAKPDPTEA